MVPFYVYMKSVIIEKLHKGTRDILVWEGWKKDKDSDQGRDFNGVGEGEL